MTLRARTLIMVTLLLCGTVLVIGSVLTWNARQAILAQQEQDGLLIAGLLARTAAIVDEFPQEQVGDDAALLDDLRQRVGLQRMVAELVAGGDVEAIRVVDSQAITLVFSGSPGIDATALGASDRDRVGQVLQDGSENLTLDGNLLKVIVPVRSSGEDARIVGAVMVFLPTDRLQAAMARQLGGAAAASVIVLVIGVVASLWLSLRISGPVASITNAATAVETGEYKHAFLEGVVGRNDELGRLGRVFDRMAREVSARDRRLKLLRQVIPAGVGLSSEKDFNRLLETIVVESQAITNADGGTLYMLEDGQLKFMIVRNTSMHFAMGGLAGEPITFPALSLYDEKTGEPNHRNIATHAALVREPVSIPDAYAAEGFDFSGTRAHDERTGYHSKSFLSIPLESDDQQVIGVLQLINAQDPETGEVVSFVVDEVFEMLVLLASISLADYIRQAQLRKEIEKLNIEIDRTKQSRQVSEITETDYFRALLKKARMLHRKNKPKS